MNKFYEQIRKSTQESQVQELFNEELKKAFNVPVIERKYQCDGYFCTDDKSVSVLIEYKYDVQMKNQTQRAKLLAQCVGYLKAFEDNKEELPKLVLCADINECFIIHTNDLLKYLDVDDVDWTIAPCNLGNTATNLVLQLAQEASPWVYDIDITFNIQTVIDQIRNLCSNTKTQIHITEKNIEYLFNIFCDRIIKNKDKWSPNDLVGAFIGNLLYPNEYYKHPRKKNTFVANGVEININSNEYDAFMGIHAVEFTPKEKRVITGISDRLVEDTKRRRTGEFYTPTIWVDYAHNMISDSFSGRWREGYVVWDCCCGTKNLTRDYDFKELYCSTLEQSEIDLSKNYNKNAISFVYDFLNEDLDVLKMKAPSLLKAFEENRPILFFINPPYSNGSKSKKGVSGHTITNTQKQMLQLDGFKQGELICQFLWKILNIKRQYNLTNIKLALFTKPTWLAGESTIKFRKLFLKHFKFEKGVLFNAGEFSGVSAQWGITFNLWSTGESENKSEFVHTLVKNVDNNIVTLKGDNDNDLTKTIYNRDNIDYVTVTNYTKPKSNFDVQKTFKLDVKTCKCLPCEKRLPIDWLGFYLEVHGDYVQNNNLSFLKSGVPTDVGLSAGGSLATPDNFDNISIVNCVRDIIDTNWVIDKDMYIIKHNHKYPEQFVHDCIIYSLFTGYTFSMKDPISNVHIKNYMFWLDKQFMLDLAEQSNNDDVYEDALNADNRFACNRINQMRNDDCNLNVSPIAKEVLNKATELVVKSFKLRNVFNESNPEYQINNWDAGWWQLKQLFKSLMPNELKEFQALFREFKNHMKHCVYEFGFLKK